MSSSIFSSSNCAKIFTFALLIVSSMTFADDGRLIDPMPPSFKAKEFKLPNLNGKIKELKEFNGKFLLVNFWSVDCQICIPELATLEQMYKQFEKKNFIIISIHAGDQVERAREIVKLNALTYPVLIDADLIMGDWGIPALPTTYLVAPDGVLKYRVVGTRVWNSPFMLDFFNSIFDSYKTDSSSNSTDI